MGTVGQLKRVQNQLIKDLRETTRSFRTLGKKYGVSRQAIFLFCHTRGITRPTTPKRQKPEHAEKKCSICKGLLKIAKKPHSDFICYETFKERLGFQGRGLASHLTLLREKGLVSPKFGRLFSKKAETAYRLYFRKRLPVKVIGRRAGFRNFWATIQRHKTSGWNVPPPLFTYDEKQRRKRRKTQLRMIKRKRKG